MVHNTRVFALHVPTDENFLADALSRGQFDRFWTDLGKMDKEVNSLPCQIPEEIWPVENIWIK